jgi:hypothetical protein
MSAGIPLNSTFTRTFSTALMNVVNGLVTSRASKATPDALTVSDLNGTNANADGTIKPIPRTVTVTTASHASSYLIAAPIVVTGKRGGVTVTENISLTAVNGGETVRGLQAFDSITSIAIPAMNDTAGSFTFGVGDLCCSCGQPFTGVELSADGTANVQYGDQPGSLTDAKLCTGKVTYPMAPTRILTSQALSVPTSVAVTVYGG